MLENLYVTHMTHKTYMSDNATGIVEDEQGRLWENEKLAKPEKIGRSIDAR